MNTAISDSRPAAGAPGDQASRLRSMVDPHAPAAHAGVHAHAPARPPQPPAEHLDPVIARRAAAGTGLARLICIASGKGGVGKTNLAVNLSAALARTGCRTVLLDADLGTANADVLCGLLPSARLDRALASAPAGPRPMRELLVEAPGGFRLVPGAAGLAGAADLSPRQRLLLVQQLGRLEREADVVVADLSAGIGPSVLSLVCAADLTLLLATPEPTSLADAYALLKCVAPRLRGQAGAGDASSAPIGLVASQVAGVEEAAVVHARLAGVAQRFLGLRVPLLGWVAQDPRVPSAVRRKVPFLLDSPRCQASRDVLRLAHDLARRLRIGDAGVPSREGGGLARALARMILPAGANRARGA